MRRVYWHQEALRALTLLLVLLLALAMGWERGRRVETTAARTAIQAPS